MQALCSGNNPTFAPAIASIDRSFEAFRKFLESLNDGKDGSTPKALHKFAKASIPIYRDADAFYSNQVEETPSEEEGAAEKNRKAKEKQEAKRWEDLRKKKGY